MSTFQALAVVSSLIMIALELVLRALQRERDQGWFLSALGSWAGVIALLPFIPYSTLNLSPSTVALLGLAGSAWAISVITELKSHATLPVGLGVLVSSLRTLGLIGIGALFFAETFTTQDIVGTALALGGVLLACLWRSGAPLTGVWSRLLASAAGGAAIVTEKALAQRTAIELIIVGGYFIPGVLYLIFRPRDWREQCVLGPTRRRTLIGLYMLLYAAVGPVFVYTFAFGQLSETFVIFQSRFVITVLLGALILQEREGLISQCVGMIITLIGLYLVMN
jgi:drug/metabolite transporter (DMT)-like permease